MKTSSHLSPGISTCLAVLVTILASALLTACGGSKSGSGGYDPNYGVVGAMDRNSIPAQKLMSTEWCSDRGTPRAFFFAQTGDLHVERLNTGWEHNRGGFARGRRRNGPNFVRGTWGLQDLQLIIRAPGLDGVYLIDMESRPNTLKLRTGAAPDGMGPGTIRLRACPRF